MKGNRGGNPDKRPQKHSKKTRAAGSGSGKRKAHSASPDGAGSSQDNIPADTDPHQLVGKEVMVPGMWWVGVKLTEEEKRRKSKCIITRHALSYKFGNRTAPAYWIREEDEGDDEYVISFQNLCYFLDKKLRPKGWDDCETNAMDLTESDSEDDEDDDGNAKAKKKQNQTKKKKVYKKTPKGNYEVSIDDLPNEEKSVRIAVEKLAGKASKTDESGWEKVPEGWHKTTDGAPKRVCDRKAFKGVGFKLKKSWTSAEAKAWTELDSWYRCHPKSATDIAVEETNRYKAQCDRNGQKQKKVYKKGWKGGINRPRYVGYWGGQGSQAWVQAGQEQGRDEEVCKGGVSDTISVRVQGVWPDILHPAMFQSARVGQVPMQKGPHCAGVG
jgi:hypothetical protein